MNLVTGTNAMYATMAVSGAVVGALALKNAALATIGLSAKVGAAVADRLDYQDTAKTLRNEGDHFVQLATKNIFTEMKVAGAFALAGLVAFVGQNYLTALNDVLPANPFSFKKNVTHFENNSTNMTSFGNNSSNLTFFGNSTNKSFTRICC